jgi:hypothetical protein
MAGATPVTATDDTVDALGPVEDELPLPHAHRGAATPMTTATDAVHCFIAGAVILIALA